MGIKRIVDRSFWTDEKVLNTFSPEDRLFMLYLLTCPDSTQLGIFKLNPRMAAFHLGYSTETIIVLLDRFESKYKLIKCSKQTNEIAIKNYLCYSIVKGGKPVFDLLVKELNSVQDVSLIEYIFKNLKSKRDLNATVKSVIEKYDIPFVDNDNANDNDNDNDNDVSYHDSYHDSSNVPPNSQGVVVGVISKPFEFWNKNMGLMTEYISEKIRDMIAEYGEVVVLEAMQRSLEQGKRTLAYVEGCCKNIHSGADKPKKEELLF